MATTVVTQQQQKQPDIQYAPDFDKWRARTESRLQNEKLRTDLPPGFPEKLESDFVWDGDTLPGKYDWVYELNESELDEIERALSHFKCKPTCPNGSDNACSHPPTHQP